METKTNNESIKQLISTFGSLENVRNSVTTWYAGYTSTKTFVKDYAKSYREEQTFEFSQLMEFFMNLEKHDLITNNQPKQ